MTVGLPDSRRDFHYSPFTHQNSNEATGLPQPFCVLRSMFWAVPSLFTPRTGSGRFLWLPVFVPGF